MSSVLRRMLLSVVLVTMMLSVGGCVPGGLLLGDVTGMTPEQIEKFEQLGYDAIRCVTMKGPPPGGTATSVTVPKKRAVTVRFVGCDVQSIEVGQTVPPNN